MTTTTKPSTKGRGLVMKNYNVHKILTGAKWQTRRVIDPQPRDDWAPVVGPYHPTKIDRHGEEYPGREVFGASDEEEGRVCRYQPGDRLILLESLYRSECDGYLCRNTDGYCSFEAWTTDGSIHWRHDERHMPDRPLKYCVGAFENTKVDQRKGSFSLDLCHCNTRMKIKSWTGNTVIDRQSIVFRRKLAPFHMPRWACRAEPIVASVRAERLQDISEADAIAEGHPPCNEGCICHFCRGRFSAVERFQQGWNDINFERAPWASNPWVFVISFKRIDQ